MRRIPVLVGTAVAIMAVATAPANTASLAGRRSIYRAATGAAAYRIVYDSQHSPKGLWIIDGNGVNPKPLRSGVFGASWSTDRKMVAFDTVSPLLCALNPTFQPGEVEVMDAAGTNLRQLGTGCFPEISPDGLHVVYVTIDQQGNEQVWVAATDGSSTVQVLPGSCTDNQCKNAFSPNWAGNSELVFAASRQDTTDNSLHPALWTIASDGTGSPSEIPGTESSTSFALGVNGLAVDPQGKTIVATGGDTNAGDHVDLYTVPLSGGSPTLLAAAPSKHFSYFPQWSADGKLIAFGDLQNIGTSQNVNFISHVDVIASSGGTPEQISGSDNTAADPSFGPEGGVTIKGHVTGIGTDKPVAGVTIKAVGPTTVETTTGSDGSYSLTLVDPGTYNVTPSGLGGTYKPGPASVDTADGDQTIDFTMGYKVSGTVTENCPRCSQSSPLEGASIVATPTDGGSGGSAQTTSDGAFEILVGPDTYTVKASKSGFSFDPASGTLAVSKDRTGINFNACPSNHASGDVGAQKARPSIFGFCEWEVQVGVEVPISGRPDINGATVVANSVHHWWGDNFKRATTGTGCGGCVDLFLPADQYTISVLGSMSIPPITKVDDTRDNIPVSFQVATPVRCDQGTATSLGCQLDLHSGVQRQGLDFEAPVENVFGDITGAQGPVTVTAGRGFQNQQDQALGAITLPTGQTHYVFWALAQNQAAAIQATDPHGAGTVTRCQGGKIVDPTTCQMVLTVKHVASVSFNFPNG